VLRDVTEREQLADQLREAQKLDSIGQLAGGIAHDLNNLLTPIVGLAELAAAREGASAGVAADLAEIRDAADRAAELTRQLLAFARRQHLEMRALDVSAVLGGLEPLLRRLIRENVQLEVDLSADLPAVRADASQLQQVVLNLVLNARDAMREGGRLLLETRAVRLQPGADAARLGLPAGPYVRLRVRDAGCGMDEATLERIFEPFFTTKALGLGTGLGLAVVHGIVKQHGGSLAVESALGRGSCFDIYLPAAAEELLEPALGPPPGGKP